MGKVRAKFKVMSVTEFVGGGKSVELSAVTGTSEEDKVFTEYTPNGNIKIGISPGKPATQQFVPGKTCYVTFDFED